MRDIVVLVFAYLLGAIPFSNLFARRLRGIDLRDEGTGTVSGTGLYRVAGFGPLALALAWMNRNSSGTERMNSHGSALLLHFFQCAIYMTCNLLSCN